MNRISFLPSLGAQGSWNLKPPYSDLVVAGAIYRCDAITLLSAYINDGNNPLEDIYQALGDTKTSFETDLANDDYLITISSTTGFKTIFPRSAMLGMPKTDGVVYQTVVATVSLSAMRKDYDFTLLGNYLKEFIKEKAGVASSVYFQATGEELLLSYEQSELMERVRQQQIENPMIIKKQYEDLLAAHALQTDRLKKLEEYVAKHFADITPPI